MENSVAVERGPLVYALRMEEDWRFVQNSDPQGDFYEVYPEKPVELQPGRSGGETPRTGFRLLRRETMPEYPWTLKGAPLELRTQGKRVPEWQLYNCRSGPLPHSRPLEHLEREPAEEIALLPYGCTRLRITEFPVAK